MCVLLQWVWPLKIFNPLFDLTFQQQTHFNTQRTALKVHKPICIDEKRTKRLWGAGGEIAVGAFQGWNNLKPPRLLMPSLIPHTSDHSQPQTSILWAACFKVHIGHQETFPCFSGLFHQVKPFPIPLGISLQLPQGRITDDVERTDLLWGEYRKTSEYRKSYTITTYPDWR